MKTKNIVLLIFATFTCILTLTYFFFNDNVDLKFSESEIELMTNYESHLFTKISEMDLMERYPEYISELKLSSSYNVSKKYNYFILNYRGFKELHVKSISSDGNCEIKAFTIRNSLGSVNSDVNFSNVFLQSDDQEFSDVPEEFGESHSCSGDPCSRCSFRRSIFTGKIIGCNCHSMGGQCNHTVSQG